MPNEMDRREAEERVAASPERFGPHVLADEAERQAAEIIPVHAPDLDYLAGRVALTLDEAQLALGIGPATLRTAIRDGQIPSTMIGGRRLVPVRALERHLEALAYAESGALDQWQQALTSASAARIAKNRRRNNERRRVTAMKRKKAREV